MKIKTFIALFFIVALISSASGQKDKHFEIGFQGGYGSVWIINQNNYGLAEMDYEYTWGGGYNFQAGYNFTENIGLFSEVGILNQGQKYKDDGAGHTEIQRDVQLKYLNAPIIKEIIPGKGDWLFWGGDNVIDHLKASSPLSSETLEKFRKIHEDRYQYCKKRGIKYLFIVPPNKSSVYKEYLPDWLKGLKSLSHFVEVCVSQIEIVVEAGFKETAFGEVSSVHFDQEL